MNPREYYHLKTATITEADVKRIADCMSERIIDSETGEIVSDGAIVKADWYGNLVDDCKAIITEGTFNSRWALVEMYWHLGERINTDNDMTRELIYGKKIVSDLSQSLSICRIKHSDLLRLTPIKCPIMSDYVRHNPLTANYLDALTAF